MGNSDEETLQRREANAGTRFEDPSDTTRKPETLGQELAPDADHYLKVTDSLCPDCVASDEESLDTIPMLVYEAEGEIRLAKECPTHGVFRDVYWSDAELYERAQEWADPENHLDTAHVTPSNITCPFDCGLCAKHRSHTGLGNITVTNRCDRSCWYCFFFAREDDPIYEPTPEQIRQMVGRMADEDPIGTNAIQLTGGEPTLRNDLVEVVEEVKSAVDHVQLNTHSGILAGDLERAKALREAGVNSVYTSFDGVSPDTNPKNHWVIPEALRTYREAGLPAVLVPTVIGGYNDHELGDMVRFAAANHGTVRGLNFQPVSLVGRMPASKRREQRVTIPDIITGVEKQTDGSIPRDAWYPIPSVLPISEFAETWNEEPLYELSNHFACGMATYVYLDGDELVPITDFFEVGPFLEAVREIADQFDTPLGRLDKARLGARLGWELYRWVDSSAEPDDIHLGRWLLEALTKGTYDGLVEFHRNSLFLGIMHFMDPYNYDTERVERCDIHYAMPDGRIVPFCAYNVLPDRYRDRVHEDHAISASELLEKPYVNPTDPTRSDRTRLRGDAVTGREETDEGRLDGPGIFGYDVKYSRDIGREEKDAIREAYRRSIEDGEPV